MKDEDYEPAAVPTPMTWEAVLRTYCNMLRSPNGNEWAKDKIVEEIAKVGALIDQSPMYESATETKPVNARTLDRPPE